VNRQKKSWRKPKPRNGTIYEIGENDKFEAVTENTDVKIKVKGMVEEYGGGNKIIMIDSFKVLD
jgi:hypothetical protein